MINVSRFDLGRLRALRRFRDVERRMGEEARRSAARVVCVASGKGGTGKSILATNIAALRAGAGERVLLVDFDAGLANAHLLLGLAPAYDLFDVLEGRASVHEALVEGPAGLRLLSGGVGRPSLANPTRRELDRLYRALAPLESEFDLVIVDHGAGMSYATLTQLAAARATLLVTNPEVTALSDAYAIYKQAARVNPDIRAGLVVNRAPDAATAERAWQRFREVSQRFLGRVPDHVGWIPQDAAVLQSVQDRLPVCLLDPTAPAARACEQVARWPAIDESRTTSAFYEKARRALR